MDKAIIFCIILLMFTAMAGLGMNDYFLFMIPTVLLCIIANVVIFHQFIGGQKGKIDKRTKK
jgi:hypothetical protein